jgi:hypothetical protein
MRTRMVTTIAGGASPGDGACDGPALQARLSSLVGMVVAPNGALLVTSRDQNSVRHISAARRGAGSGSGGERRVTTLVGPSGPSVVFTHLSNGRSFSRGGGGYSLDPEALALHAPPRTPGRLYVGCADNVHVFDLDSGEHKAWRTFHIPTGMALNESGTRLFVAECCDVQYGDRLGGLSRGQSHGLSRRTRH